MDDLAVCVSSDSTDGLIRKIGIMLGSLLETCLSHAMTPNVDPGKTELLLTLRGAGSRRWKRHYFGPHSDHLFHALGEHQCYAVRVTGRYKHLGGIIHHSSDQRHEARHRVGQAHQILTRQKRLLFRNPHIALKTQIQLFDSVVMSSFGYGSETWVLQDLGSKTFLHNSVIKLYRRLLGLRADGHYSDEDIL